MKKYEAPKLMPTEYESTDVIVSSGPISTFHGFMLGNDAADAGIISAGDIDAWWDLLNT